jgi:hypothetical protein
MRRSVTVRAGEVPVFTPMDVLPSFNNRMAEAIKPYQFDATAPGYAELHPFKAAMRGFGAMGIPGIWAVPQQARQYAQQRRDTAAARWQEYYNKALEQQKSIDAIIGPRIDTQLKQALVDKGRQTGDVDPNAPDLYQQDLPSMDGTPVKQYDIPPYSKEALAAYQQGVFGASDVNYYNAASEPTQRNGYQVPLSVLNPVNKQPGLNAGITNYVPAEIPRAPFFVNDPKAIIEHLASVRNQAIKQGQKRYQFNEEAPQRQANVQKALAEVALHQAQTATEKRRPALIQAETKYKNEQDRGGGSRGGHPPQMTTAGMAYMLYQSGQWGKPGTPEAVQGLQDFMKGAPMDSETITTDADGKVISRSKTNRGRGGVASNSELVSKLIETYSPQGKQIQSSQAPNPVQSEKSTGKPLAGTATNSNSQLLPFNFDKAVIDMYRPNLRR